MLRVCQKVALASVWPSNVRVLSKTPSWRIFTPKGANTAFQYSSSSSPRITDRLGLEKQSAPLLDVAASARPTTAARFLCSASKRVTPSSVVVRWTTWKRFSISSNLASEQSRGGTTRLPRVPPGCRFPIDGNHPVVELEFDIVPVRIAGGQPQDDRSRFSRPRRDRHGFRPSKPAQSEPRMRGTKE